MSEMFADGSLGPYFMMAAGMVADGLFSSSERSSESGGGSSRGASSSSGSRSSHRASGRPRRVLALVPEPKGSVTWSRFAGALERSINAVGASTGETVLVDTAKKPRTVANILDRYNFDVVVAGLWGTGEESGYDPKHALVELRDRNRVGAWYTSLLTFSDGCNPRLESYCEGADIPNVRVSKTYFTGEFGPDHGLYEALTLALQEQQARYLQLTPMDLAIVGAGKVGKALFRRALYGYPANIRLMTRGGKKLTRRILESEVETIDRRDIRQALVRRVRTFSGNRKLTKHAFINGITGAEIVYFTFRGADEDNVERGLDHVELEAVKEYANWTAEAVAKGKFDGVAVVTTNPPCPLTYVFQRESGLPPGKVVALTNLADYRFAHAAREEILENSEIRAQLQLLPEEDILDITLARTIGTHAGTYCAFSNLEIAGIPYSVATECMGPRSRAALERRIAKRVINFSAPIVETGQMTDQETARANLHLLEAMRYPHLTPSVGLAYEPDEMVFGDGHGPLSMDGLSQGFPIAVPAQFDQDARCFVPQHFKYDLTGKERSAVEQAREAGLQALRTVGYLS